jgi:DNA-binding beta-propeller fold protein YncE
MTRRTISAALLLAIALVSPTTARAQTFKVEKWNIGGDGGTDYLVAEPGTGRVFVSRGTHVMVIDGATGKVLGDIPDTPRMHGIGLAAKWNHGFTTNGGDSTVTMFDLTTLAFIKKIPIKVGGLDGIMYDDFSDHIILTNHSRPGTAVALDANTGDIVGTAVLEDNAPEGAASDGKGKLFVNNESKNTIQVLDAKTMSVLASWPLAPCDGPTGIALDRPTNRIFSGCGKTSVVLDASTGKVVATIANGDGVDALGYDDSEKLIYIPGSGGTGTVTVVRQDSPDKYTVVATVPTMRGAKTIAVDPIRHMAYLFQPEYGPLPAGTPAPAPGTRGPRGPIIGAWFFAISH